MLYQDGGLAGGQSINNHYQGCRKRWRDHVEKGEETTSSSPTSYHDIKLLSKVLGLWSMCLQEVVAIRRKLLQNVDLYIDMDQKKIMYPC
jgi:hypothetical protein